MNLKNHNKNTPLCPLSRGEIFVVFYFLTTMTLFSQVESMDYDSSKRQEIFKRSDWFYGGFADFQLNYHNVNFSALPNVPSCCPDYKIGMGYSPVFGGFLNYSLSYKNDFFVGVRLSYSNFGGLLQSQEWEWMNNGPNESVLGLIEHEINTSIDAINIEPVFTSKLTNDLSMSLGFSFNAYVSTFFEQKETLLKPEDLLFENDQRIRMTYSGDIKGAGNHNVGVTVGLNYDLMKSNTRDWYLSPEIFYYYGFNNITPSQKWNIQSLRLGISFVVNERKIIEYKMPREIEEDTVAPKIEERLARRERIDTVKYELVDISDTALVEGIPTVIYDTTLSKNIKTITERYYRTDTLQIPKEYELTATIAVSPVNEDGKEIPLPVFQVEEFLSARMHPLLNYVFYDENSSVIPPRYKRMDRVEMQQFNIDSLFNLTTLEVYYYILNIIGKRMHDYPKAKLTLVGCNADVDLEKGNLQLSKERAESVKQYLTDNWNIPEQRIILKSRKLPQNRSNPKTPEGIEENRRVEIYSNEINIISPVITNDTLIKTTILGSAADTTMKPTFIGLRLFSNVQPKIKLDSWQISILQGKDTLKRIVGSGDIPKEHNWFTKTESESNKLLSKPVKIILSVKDSRGKHAMVEGELKIERKTISKKQENREGDKKIDSYSLILFDFGSTAFTEANKDIPKFVGKLVDRKSTIKVTGYSDRVGDDVYNKTLSARRAKAVADAIRHPNTKYDGVGEEVLLYDNDLPEGRFYCRTVDIVVETPIQW